MLLRFKFQDVRSLLIPYSILSPGGQMCKKSDHVLQPDKSLENLSTWPGHITVYSGKWFKSLWRGFLLSNRTSKSLFKTVQFNFNDFCWREFIQRFNQSLRILSCCCWICLLYICILIPLGNVNLGYTRTVYVESCAKTRETRISNETSWESREMHTEQLMSGIVALWSCGLKSRPLEVDWQKPASECEW